MLIDTHAHINFNAYKNDAEEVIKRSLDNDVWMINVGSQYTTSKRAVEIAEKYPEGVYAAVGLHPIHLETSLVKIKDDFQEIEIRTKEEDFHTLEYESLVKSSKKVVAIGEIGLDYYYRPKTKIKLQEFKEKQKVVFLKQLELAKELNLPVIFHCRMAHDDLIEVLTQYHNSTNYTMVENVLIRGVIHCFTGNWEQAEKFLEMRFYLGFNGLIFKLDFDEIIRKTPLEKILIETDCPYLTPPTSVNQRLNQRRSAVIRNEPLYVKYVAEKIAKIKNLSYGEVAKITTENAKKLFRLT